MPLRLRERREAKGWSQERLAEEMGTSDATIARVENGKQNWNQEFLQLAAEVLGCHEADLLPIRPGSVLDIWAGVPDERRPVALDVLKGLARKQG